MGDWFITWSDWVAIIKGLPSMLDVAFIIVVSATLIVLMFYIEKDKSNKS